jgi:mono/diheme cytochrome c family protein
VTRILTNAMACGAALFAVPALAAPGEVTFTRDVLPILQENCQVCHRPGGANLGGMVAPMSLVKYEEVRPWAKSLQRVVASKYMPPWHASSEFDGVFSNQRTLTDKEIETLVAWVDQGAKRGRPEDAPAPASFPETAEGWAIGEPDLVVSMPEPYFVEDDVQDIYRTFYTQLTDEQLPADRWIKAIEFRPGSSVVHHIISDPLGGIAPGNDPTVYPDGYAQILRAGGTISWQMHYHKEPGPGTGVWDQSKAGIKFYPEGYEPEHPIRMAPLGNFTFEIPAGEKWHTEHASEQFHRPVQILSYTPHMHLRGKYAKYVAKYPDGSTETLLEVPSYDFNWQTTYWYKEPKLLPAGASIDLTMAWDNSAENPFNPDPSKNVRFGQPTTDEMMFGFVSYAYQEEPTTVEVSERTLKRYVGEYQLTGDLPMRVSIGLDNGNLTASMMGREPAVLTPESDTLFTVPDIGLTVQFIMFENQFVEKVLFKIFGQQHEAERVDQPAGNQPTD